jgi:hypothetical protein
MSRALAESRTTTHSAGAEFNQVSRTLRPQKQRAIRACDSLAFWLAAMYGIAFAIQESKIAFFAMLLQG